MRFFFARSRGDDQQIDYSDLELAEIDAVRRKVIRTVANLVSSETGGSPQTSLQLTITVRDQDTVITRCSVAIR